MHKRISLARTPLFANLYSLSVEEQYYALTSNVDDKAIDTHPITNAAKQTQTKQITSIQFLSSVSSRHHLRPPAAATIRHLPPNSSPHTYVSSESGDRAPPKTLYSHCTLTSLTG